MCGVFLLGRDVNAGWVDGGYWRTADRRPIDPPPVVQLRVIDKSASRSSSPDGQCVIPFFLPRIQSDRVMNSFSLPLNPVCFSHSLPAFRPVPGREYGWLLSRLTPMPIRAKLDTSVLTPPSFACIAHRRTIDPPAPRDRDTPHHVPPLPFMIDPRGCNLMGHLTEPYCSCSLALLLLPLSLPLWLDIAI